MRIVGIVSSMFLEDWNSSPCPQHKVCPFRDSHLLPFIPHHSGQLYSQTPEASCHSYSYSSENVMYWLIKSIGLCNFPIVHTEVNFISVWALNPPIPKHVFFLFLWYWCLNSGRTLQTTLPALFCDGLFWDRVSQTIYLGWLPIVILLTSACWVARITGVSHQRLAKSPYALPYSIRSPITAVHHDSLTSLVSCFLLGCQTACKGRTVSAPQAEWEDSMGLRFE
jgi:hypothetical protein